MSTIPANVDTVPRTPLAQRSSNVRSRHLQDYSSRGITPSKQRPSPVAALFSRRVPPYHGGGVKGVFLPQAGRQGVEVVSGGKSETLEPLQINREWHRATSTETIRPYWRLQSRRYIPRHPVHPPSGHITTPSQAPSSTTSATTLKRQILSHIPAQQAVTIIGQRPLRPPFTDIYCQAAITAAAKVTSRTDPLPECIYVPLLPPTEEEHREINNVTRARSIRTVHVEQERSQVIHVGGVEPCMEKTQSYAQAPPTPPIRPGSSPFKRWQRSWHHLSYAPKEAKDEVRTRYLQLREAV